MNLHKHCLWVERGVAAPETAGGMILRTPHQKLGRLATMAVMARRSRSRLPASTGRRAAAFSARQRAATLDRFAALAMTAVPGRRQGDCPLGDEG